MAKIFPSDSSQNIVNELIRKAKGSASDDRFNLYKNKIDPFSALIDSMLQGISLTDWLNQEKVRQSQKTLQNLIGDFHQSVIASLDGWENLGSGGIIDIRNEKLKIAAEIKNKYNTTKGSHKIQIYRDIETILKNPAYEGFTGYYVEIIPSGKGTKVLYDKRFVPSDNRKSTQPPVPRDDIRIIDGKSFYKIATGEEDALEQLYKSLPNMIRKALGDRGTTPEKEDLFIKLFEKAFR